MATPTPSVMIGLASKHQRGDGIEHALQAKSRGRPDLHGHPPSPSSMADDSAIVLQIRCSQSDPAMEVRTQAFNLADADSERACGQETSGIQSSVFPMSTQMWVQPPSKPTNALERAQPDEAAAAVRNPSSRRT
jgi:hypothetical protein